jgi:hypothetical protein
MTIHDIMYPRRRAHACALSILLVAAAAPASTAQQSSGEPSRGNRPARQGIVDSARASVLYVSNRVEDHPAADFDAHIRNKARTDSIYRANARGSYDFQKITYRSSVDGMTIPAYLTVPKGVAPRNLPTLSVWRAGWSLSMRCGRSRMSC